MILHRNICTSAVFLCRLFKLLLKFANVRLARRDLQLLIISASKFMKLALITARLNAKLKVWLKARLKASKILCLQ